MNWLHSFRWRILLGTVLWTLGLIPLMHLLFLVVHGQLHFMPGWGIEIFLVFATLCILAGIWQFRAGLLPFGRLRQTTIGSARWFRRQDRRNLSNRSAAIGERS